jgi:hypothetical protein
MDSVQNGGDKCEENARTNFLQLPLELRQTIYKLCLSLDQDLNICVTSASKAYLDDYEEDFADRHHVAHFPNCSYQETIDLRRRSRLVRVSRQLHAEASPFLYCNRFTFDSWVDFNCFCTIVGPENAKCMQAIRIPLPLLATRGSPLRTASDERKFVSSDGESLSNRGNSLTSWATTGLASLSKFPRLRHVTFAMPDDLTVLDLRVAGHFRQIPDSCRVSIEPGFQFRKVPHPHMDMKDRLCGLALEVEDLFISKRWDRIECFPKRKKLVHERSDDEE